MKEKSIKNLDKNSRIQVSQEFRLKNIDETRNYFLEEKKQNELMSKKYGKVYLALSYFRRYWMYFNFCFYFFACYSYRNYKFCNSIKSWCNSYRKKKV